MRNYKTIALFALLVSQGCITSTTKDNRMLGHWHRVSTDNWTYQTIDIEDTVTITDKYNLLSGDYLEYARVDRRGKQILPASIYQASESFTLKDDTLTIQDSVWTYKYVRSDLSECLISDRYVACPLTILLPNSASSDKFELSYKTFCSEELFIGRPKPGIKFIDSLLLSFPDSIFIRRGDVYIQLRDFPRLSKHWKNMCADNNNPLNINLHGDRNVPDDFLKRIESVIPTDVSIHRIVNSGTGDIGLKKVR